VTVTYPNAKTVSRTFDHADQLVDVTDWLGNTTKITPNPNGQVSSIASPNATDTYAYTSNGQLASNAAVAGPYAYDGAGNLTQLPGGTTEADHLGWPNKSSGFRSKVSSAALTLVGVVYLIMPRRERRITGSDGFLSAAGM